MFECADENTFQMFKKQLNNKGIFPQSTPVVGEIFMLLTGYWR